MAGRADLVECGGLSQCKHTLLNISKLWPAKVIHNLPGYEMFPQDCETMGGRRGDRDKEIRTIPFVCLTDVLQFQFHVLKFCLSEI